MAAEQGEVTPTMAQPAKSMGTISNHEIGALMAPISFSTFLNDYYGKNFLHIPGSADKFSDLLDWTEFNSLLSHHRLDFPRLRLAKDGGTIPADSYITYAVSRRGVKTPKLEPTVISKLLKEGATLILDAIDEMHLPISELAQTLEKLLKESFQVNAYVGWGEVRGFDIHWDDHDVFVLQILGRKDWKIFGPTREAPQFRDVEFDAEKPTMPIWEGTLQTGDFLYIPRGWWHVATPKNEPTLHLTFGFTNRTGVDLIAWLQGKLLAFPEFRKDLPKFATEAECDEHFEKMNSVLKSVWNKDSIRQFLLDQEIVAKPRVKFNLPWGALEGPFANTDNLNVRLNAPRELTISIDEEKEELSFSALGNTWRFDKAANGIFEALMKTEECKIGDLCEKMSEKIDSETVKTFLGELLENGLIEVRNPG